MPSQAEALTEAHRLAQAKIGARTVADMLAVWSLLDPKRVDATTAAWLRVAVRLVGVRRVESARLAGDYLSAVRLLETGSSFAPLVAGVGNPVAVATSLTITGPGSLKRATKVRPLVEAVETAQVNAARSGMRHALAGGRDTITATLAADREAVGFRRVTSAKPCDFCSMLAGRGAVYGEDTVHFAAHDGCACSAQPVYGN